MLTLALARASQESQSKCTLCCPPFAPPRRVSGVTLGLQLWIADGGDCRKFFECSPLLKGWAVSAVLRHACADERAMDLLILRISW